MAYRKTGADSGMIVHMVMNSLRSYNKQFRDKFGQVCICGDGKSPWRKDIFPYYKAGRKKSKEDSGLDWQLIYDTLNKIREDIPKYFPYRYVWLDGAEADDLIATLSTRVKEDHVVISSDGDFVQLLQHDWIKLYNPRTKKFIKSSNPKDELFEKILSGDKGDGIPNFLSQGNSFVDSIRQNPVSAKKISEALKTKNPRMFCEKKEHIDFFTRNQQLIDFDYIPEEVSNAIIQKFSELPQGNMNTIYKYLIENKLRNLLENIEDFRNGGPKKMEKKVDVSVSDIDSWLE